jgi:hypothetical protein
MNLPVITPCPAPLRIVAPFLLAAALAACGGGGGDSPTPAPPPPAPPASTPVEPPPPPPPQPPASQPPVAPPPPAVPGVVTLQIETGTYATNAGITLSPDRLQVSFGDMLNPACQNRLGDFADAVFADVACNKRAVRASGGVRQGEFRYYEGHRLLGEIANIGFGYTTRNSAIDPYCCLVDLTQPVSPRTPPSMSINAQGGLYVRLRNVGGYSEAATQYYGFAVDYRGNDPVVYVVTTNATTGNLSLNRQVTPGFRNADGTFQEVVPFMYGHTGLANPGVPVAEYNFGSRPFHYAIPALRTALREHMSETAANQLVPGVGVVVPQP